MRVEHERRTRLGRCFTDRCANRIGQALGRSPLVPAIPGNQVAHARENGLLLVDHRLPKRPREARERVGGCRCDQAGQLFGRLWRRRRGHTVMVGMLSIAEVLRQRPESSQAKTPRGDSFQILKGVTSFSRPMCQQGGRDFAAVDRLAQSRAERQEGGIAGCILGFGGQGFQLRPAVCMMTLASSPNPVPPAKSMGIIPQYPRRTRVAVRSDGVEPEKRP